MKGITKYKKIASKVNNETKKLMMKDNAIPLFTMFFKPVNIKNSEEMMYGYVVSGKEVIGMGVVLEQLKQMVDELEKQIFE